MVEIFFTACSLLHGAQCRDFSLVYTDVPILTCMMVAQPEIAKWAEGHPNWTVSRWSCRPAGLYAKA